MSDTNLNINIRAIDQASGQIQKIQNTLNNISHRTEDWGRSMRTAGREISQVGTTISLLGATITAPLLLAYNSAAQYSAGITRQIYEMKKSYTDLSFSIGQALLPIMERFTEFLRRLVDRWNQLSPIQQQHIIQTIYLTGVYSTLGGLTLKVFGDMIRLIGNVAILMSGIIANFGMLVKVLSVIGLIVAAVNLIPEAFQTVLDILERIYYRAVAVFHEIAAGVNTLRGKMKEALAEVDKANAAWYRAIIGPPSGGHGDMATSFKKTTDQINKAVESLKDFGVGYQDIMKLITKTGGLDKVVSGSAKSPGFLDGVKQQMEVLREQMGDFVQAGKQMVSDLASSMTNAMSTLFFDAFTGQLKNAHDVFVQWGNAILRTFTDMLAKMVVKWIISGIGNIFGGFGGGAPSAPANTKLGLNSFAVGTDYVPRDMVAMIHQGERIIPAAQNVKGSSGVQITISPVIQLWDASDVQRNQKMLTDIISQSIVQNGQMRQLIRKYGA